MIKIGINGFGRIGRALFKINQKHNYFDVVHINDIDPDLKNMIYLLQYDSTYGKYEKDIEYIDETHFSIDGKVISYSAEDYIENVDWNGAELIVCATGIKKNIIGVKNLINKSIIRKAVVTHASDLVDNTIIMGVNEDEYKSDEDNLLSSSICDANAVAQALYHIDNKWGIKNCFFTTLHPWLSYQNLVDGTLKSISSPGHFWKDYALGRSATESMIPKLTTAASAVINVLPNLKNKVDAISFRTPTAIVSSSDMTITLNKNIDENEVKQYFKTIAKGNKYMLYNDESLISIDYKQTEESSIIDGQWIKVLDKNVLKIVLWYDNEWGYSASALGVAKLITKK